MAINAANIAGSATDGCRGREEDEFYATPFSATRALLDTGEFKGCHSVLEPACGEGHIAKVLKDSWIFDEVVATDLVERRNRFGIPMTGGVNFLTHDYGRTFDAAITNPPFSLAQRFIERMAEVATKRYAVLAKIQLLEGAERYSFWRKANLKCVYVFSRRVSTLRGGEDFDEDGKPWSTTLCLAWYVFDPTFFGDPRIDWILPKDDSPQMQLDFSDAKG